MYVLRRQKVLPEESLKALPPDIAAQWRPTRNEKLIPWETTVLDRIEKSSGNVRSLKIIYGIRRFGSELDQEEQDV